jgi:hypothetical protein
MTLVTYRDNLVDISRIRRVFTLKSTIICLLTIGFHPASLLAGHQEKIIKTDQIVMTGNRNNNTDNNKPVPTTPQDTRLVTQPIIFSGNRKESL